MASEEANRIKERIETITIERITKYKELVEQLFNKNFEDIEKIIEDISIVLVLYSSPFKEIRQMPEYENFFEVAKNMEEENRIEKLFKYSKKILELIAIKSKSEFDYSQFIKNLFEEEQKILKQLIRENRNLREENRNLAQQLYRSNENLKLLQEKMYGGIYSPEDTSIVENYLKELDGVIVGGIKIDENSNISVKLDYRSVKTILTKIYSVLKDSQFFDIKEITKKFIDNFEKFNRDTDLLEALTTYSGEMRDKITAYQERMKRKEFLKTFIRLT